VVLIVSDICGRDGFQHASETLLPSAVVDRLDYRALYCPDITELKMTKVLQTNPNPNANPDANPNANPDPNPNPD